MKLRRLSTRSAGFGAKLAALTRYEAVGNAAVGRVVRSIIAETYGRLVIRSARRATGEVAARPPASCRSAIL